MRVGSLGREDLREHEMATHASILAWKIPWTEEPCELQSMRPQRVRHSGTQANTHPSFYLPHVWVWMKLTPSLDALTN